MGERLELLERDLRLPGEELELRVREVGEARARQRLRDRALVALELRRRLERRRRHGQVHDQRRDHAERGLRLHERLVRRVLDRDRDAVLERTVGAQVAPGEADLVVPGRVRARAHQRARCAQRDGVHHHLRAGHREPVLPLHGAAHDHGAEPAVLVVAVIGVEQRRKGRDVDDARLREAARVLELAERLRGRGTERGRLDLVGIDRIAEPLQRLVQEGNLLALVAGGQRGSVECGHGWLLFARSEIVARHTRQSEGRRLRGNYFRALLSPKVFMPIAVSMVWSRAPWGTGFLR